MFQCEPDGSMAKAVEYLIVEHAKWPAVYGKHAVRVVSIVSDLSIVTAVNTCFQAQRNHIIVKSSEDLRS